jgi:DNA polymerase
LLEYPEQGVGVYKRLIEKILRSSGIPPEQARVTYLYHCQPPPGVRPRKADREACKVWLWKELVLTRPSVILAMGQGPTSLLQRTKSVKIAEAAGKLGRLSYLPNDRTLLIPYHPITTVYKGSKSLVYDLIDLLKDVHENLLGQ